MPKVAARSREVDAEAQSAVRTDDARALLPTTPEDRASRAPPLPRAVHLGYAPRHARLPGRALLAFLRRTESDYLYLVGDIVDGWQLKRRWYWHQSHNDVIQKLLRKARKGTKVIYIPGNHDEAARHFVGVAFGDIAIMRRSDPRDRGRPPAARDARRPVRRRRPVREMARAAGRCPLHVHAEAQPARQRGSRAARAALLVAVAVPQAPREERRVATSRRSRRPSRTRPSAAGFDGVVCGHIHKAEIREIDGVLYCNDGDWVESLTALAETFEGGLVILRAQDILAAPADSDTAAHRAPIRTRSRRS